MLSTLGQYQGEADFVRLNFKNGILEVLAKYELGWFLLRQSHMN